MTSISQIIPNYSIGGISDQPDELKKPGQLRDCLNAYPDIVHGLYRRPGFELIGQLIDNRDGDPADQDGTWFPFIRQNLVSKTQENYLFQVGTDGQLRAWDDEGTGIPVYYNKVPLSSKDIQDGNIEVTDEDDFFESEGYFKTEDDNSLRVCTINNYTVVTNPDTGVSMNKNNNERPFEAFIEVKQLAYNREYLLGIDILKGAEDEDDETKYRVASKVNLVEVEHAKTDKNKDPSCPGTYRATVTVDKSYLKRGTDRDQRDLILEITTQGVQTPGTKRTYCSYNHTVSIVNGGINWAKNDQILVYQKGGDEPEDDNDIGYLIEIDDTDTVYSPSQYPVTGITTPTSGDEIATIGKLLSDMKYYIWNNSPIKKSSISICGNGLYITHKDPFTVTTSEADLMNILSNTEEQIENPYCVVNNVSRLPVECKNGMIAKVSNAFTDDDDYWVQFKSNYGDVEDDDDDAAASGYWEEVAEPGSLVTLNSNSMPHVIVYARKDGNPVFVVSPIKWVERTCGDEDFNPSFVDSPITNVLFYRNRLCFLSQENIILSKAGDLFNFFPGSAIGVAADDPIDLSVSTNYSSVLQDGIVINNGLVLFSKYQQFQFGTANDVLSPTTAKVSEVSRYEFDTRSRPFALGTNIGFVGPSTPSSDFFEMTNVFSEGPVDVTERSKIVTRSLPHDIDLIAESKETGIVFFGHYGKDYLWGYRYFKEGNQRDVQAAWFRWQLPDTLVNHFIVDGDYYAVVNRENESQYIRLKLDALPIEGPFEDYWYREEDSPGFEKSYTTRLDFPTVNVLKAEQNAYRADTTASLTIHRMNFNFADIGTYSFVIGREGLDDYKVLYESRYMDEYKADEDPLVTEVERTVPVYTRNTSLNVALETDYKHPLVLRSMRWEGDYNQRFYKRV